MVSITYIEHNGERHTVEATPGMNLMESATLNMVPGVDGQCGGICSCATCHCYLPESWSGLVPTAGEGELQMVEFAKYRQPNSRLGCQVILTEAHDGLEVHLPAEQGGIGD
jgi:2Fe-2S ferredoxin